MHKRNGEKSLFRILINDGLFELVVLDNGSTDDTPGIIAAFAGRLRYHRTEHQDPPSCLSAGLAQTKGEYVFTLDADDLWEKDKMRRVLDIFSKDRELGAVFHDMQIADGQGRPTGEFVSVEKEGILRVEDVLARPLVSPSFSSMAFRRDVLEKILPLPRSSGLVPFDAYLARHALFFAPGYHSTAPLTLYRRHGRSWSDRWGEAKAHPKDLLAGHRATRWFNRSLERRARERGVSFHYPAGVIRRQRSERLEELVLLNAHRGARRRARRLLGLMQADLPNRTERWFKALALRTAIAAPGAYGRLYLLYRRYAALTRWRRLLGSEEKNS